MDVGMIIGLVVVSIVAGIMIIIGIYQLNRKDNPVGIYIFVWRNCGSVAFYDYETSQVGKRI